LQGTPRTHCPRFSLSPERDLDQYVGWTVFGEARAPLGVVSKGRSEKPASSAWSDAMASSR
jgi:hypothetical protein